MIFLTLEQGQLGALVGEVVVDLPAASNALGMALRSSSLAELLEVGDDEAHAAWGGAERALEEGLANRAFSDVRPVAPIPRPKRNIFLFR